MIQLSRRHFFGCLAAAPHALAQSSAEPIIDIHQHTHYSGRSDEDLIRHQREMGVTTTILLPAGSKYGLAAEAGGNDTVVAIAKQFPKHYYYFANELPDIPEAKAVIEKYLKMGALGIGEQKFPVDIDSPHIHLIADIAEHYHVPVLLHFEYKKYNLGIENYQKVIARHPKVNFIGHAQTWWANIDSKCDQAVLYPPGPVTPGGITDRLLSDYPNVWGDMSAGSGLNSMTRDEDHARDFIKRHQDRLLFGSDCNDREANGPKCLGGKIIASIRRLAPDKAAERKILYQNAAQLFKIT
jgi:predicted TIM-barrel fold metal-dependent hydrolase